MVDAQKAPRCKGSFVRITLPIVTTMRKVIITACLIALLTAVAAADKLILIDGREFEGIVTTEADTILIIMEYGRVRFNRNEVLRIELKDLPKVELSRKLEQIPADDPDAMLSVAKWAAENGLRRDAEQILADVLKLDTDHPGARRELGYVKIDKKWHPFDNAVEIARSKLEAGQLTPLLTSILPDLEKVAGPRGKLAAVREIVAYTRLRAGKFNAAASTFLELADKNEGNAARRYSEIAEIIRENTDGMYVLREAYPPEWQLLGRRSPTLLAGPASLTNPLVLTAALRDRAKKKVRSGRKIMSAARKLEHSDPKPAHLKYKRAMRMFEHADALSEGIARSYRVEIIRRRIDMVRRDSDAEARKFDAMVKTLGKESFSPQAYRRKLLDMIRRVDNICVPLKEILALTKPYPRDLFLEIQWAESDLKKMKTIRNVLTETLNDKG